MLQKIVFEPRKCDDILAQASTPDNLIVAVVVGCHQTRGESIHCFKKRCSVTSIFVDVRRDLENENRPEADL